MSVNSFDIYMDKRPAPIQNLTEDVGEPLILTPLIDEGKIDEALEKSRVTYGPLNVNATSYSGYFTVDSQYNSNLFFWFFLAEIEPETAPVLLWLQGGPGSSSIYALFTENGPFIVDSNLTLLYREFSWTKHQSVLYIDNPAGTGFSFTTNGFAQNQTKVGEDLYEALQQFFKLFPGLQQNEFYITGESYGGHFIPAIGHYIHRQNPIADLKINLKGIAIGNPLTDAKYQSDYTTYLYYVGLAGAPILDTCEKIHEQVIAAIDIEDYNTASILFNKLRTTLHRASDIPNVYNYLELLPEDSDYWVDYLIQENIRKEIHIGNVSYGATDGEVSDNLFADKTVSVGPWLAELIDNNYKVLLYNGQMDTLDPYPLMINLVKNLNFTFKEEYLEAQRSIWRVDGKIAGYSKSVRNFTEVLVRNAGHMVPTFQPEWCYNLVYNFVRGIPLSSD